MLYIWLGQGFGTSVWKLLLQFIYFSIDIFEMDYKMFIFKRKCFIAHNL